jgi:hypothetical protein
MPAHRFYRFGKHYRAGLQAPERVSSVRNQGSEVSGQSVEQSRGNAAKSVSGVERCPLTASPSCQRSRLTSNVKRGVSFAKGHLSKCPTARRRATSSGGNRPAIVAAAACPIGLVRGFE